MSNPQAVTPLTSIYESYIRAGFALVPITSGKGPTGKGWNDRGNAVTTIEGLDSTVGYGLAHAYSTPITCALDIDSWSDALPLMMLCGIDLLALAKQADSVMIDSGNPGHAKFLFSLPEPLPSKKVIVNGVTVYELRCATTNDKTVQDVLPSAIAHPKTGQPYRWIGSGHFSKLPTIPAPLLSLWQSMLSQDRERIIASGDAVKTSWQEVQQALSYISPDCTRDEWVHVGMALQWAGSQTGQPDQALYLWNEWSKGSETKYPGEHILLQQWRSFKPDKVQSVKLGTLFHYARKAGWERPAPDITSLFASVNSAAPETLTASFRPTPPDMDLSLWPDVLRRRAEEVGKGIGCDPLVPLLAGLAAVAGAVDAQTRLELLPDFKVPPVLWLMTIGKPAQKKSPGSKPMFTPLAMLEQEDQPNYSQRRLQWEGREAAHDAAKKAFILYNSSPDGMLNPDGSPEVPDLPAPPAPLRITVSDITSQKLVRYGADHPRGVLCVLDEMKGWCSKLTDRGSGEDRSAWVVGYEASPYQMDRVNAGPVLSTNFAVSIYGNCQPGVFTEYMHALSSDGLLQRFIPAVLRSCDWGIGDPLPEYLTNKPQWEQTLRIAFAMPPQTYTLTSEARTVYREFQHWYSQAARDEDLAMSNDTFMTAFGKLEGTVGRLALVWHVIESPFSPTVSADLMRRVVRMVKSYIIPSFRYTLSQMSKADSFDVWMTEYVIQNCDKPTMTLNDIRKSARRQLEGVSLWQQGHMVIGAMGVLEEGGWVMRLDDGSQERQSYAAWAINPTLAEKFKEHRQAVIAAKQRQREHIYRLSTKGTPSVHGYAPN